MNRQGFKALPGRYRVAGVRRAAFLRAPERFSARAVRRADAPMTDGRNGGL